MSADSPFGPVDTPPAQGRDARRTAVLRGHIQAGRHPLTRLPLHADAATERTGDGLRCRDCTHLQHRRGYLKCEQVGDSCGPGTDARAWWPACRMFTPKEISNA